MALSVEQSGATELQWDIPRIIGTRQNQSSGWEIDAQLSPTAVTPAIWGLAPPSGVMAWVWDIFFSSDTAIQWRLAKPAAVLALAGPYFLNLGPTSTAPASFSGAQVIAQPGLANGRGGGYAAAGAYVNVLGKSWIGVQPSTQLLLITAATAANCWCTIYWTEFTD